MQQLLSESCLGAVDCHAWAKLVKDDADLQTFMMEILEGRQEQYTTSLFQQPQACIQDSQEEVKLLRRKFNSSDPMERITRGNELKKARLGELQMGGGAAFSDRRSGVPPLPPSKGNRLSRRQQRLTSEPDGLRRREVELAQKQKYAILLAEDLELCGFPIVQELASSPNLLKALAVQSGRDRPNTIKNRLSHWKKFREWLQSAKGRRYIWPFTVSDVLDYLEHRFEEPCARTVPESVANAISYLERVGDVLDSERRAISGPVQRAVANYTSILATGAPPKNKAILILFLMIVAIEMDVMDGDLETYIRVYAWSKGLKLWAALRTDDLLGLPAQLLVMRRFRLEALLERTKTSGPARKVSWLPIFVSTDAYLSEPDWLQTGFELATTGSFAFDRDYCIPMPSLDLSGAIQQMPTYVDFATFSQSYWRQLKRPKLDCMNTGEPFFFKGDEYMFHTDAVQAITEHAERDWLASAASAAGLKKDSRNYIGRWVPEQSDDYVRTAGQKVTSIQSKIATLIRTGRLVLDEEDSFTALETRVAAKGWEESAQLGMRVEIAGITNEYAAKMKTYLASRAAGGNTSSALQSQTGVEPIVVDGDAQDFCGEAAAQDPNAELSFGDAGLELASDLLPEQAEEEHPYFLAQVRKGSKRTYKRLHKTASTSCSTKPGFSSLQFSWVADYRLVSYDAVCFRCWPKSDFDRLDLENHLGTTNFEAVCSDSEAASSSSS